MYVFIPVSSCVGSALLCPGAYYAVMNDSPARQRGFFHTLGT